MVTVNRFTLTKTEQVEIDVLLIIINSQINDLLSFAHNLEGAGCLCHELTALRGFFTEL